MAMDARRWISFLEQDLLAEPDVQQCVAADAFLWRHQEQELSPSLENESSKGEPLSQGKPCSKKRARDETYPAAGGVIAKSCREKMRRDRLNDRFVELSAVLEPDKPPKTDKASILRDAARILSQLRSDTQHLKDANHQLQETIKELKAEKNELRDEKFTLKSEKERLERELDSVNGIPSDYNLSHAPVVHVASVAAFNPSTGGPHMPKSDTLDVPYSLAMSRWMHQATVDVSNDRVLRPHVA
ncbi:hypothetical protein GOP47_0027342 [Adiantum capillus-veneris]|nr:hypothetical protein GOP47_0027342 [Adiantum capillus-veneris]